MKKKRAYITVFILTFIVALSPMLIPNTSGYTTQSVETVQVHFDVANSPNTDAQAISDGDTVIYEVRYDPDGRASLQEQSVPGGQPSLSAANSQPVPDGFLFALLGFALLVSVFVYMSYRRKSAPADEEEQAEK